MKHVFISAGHGGKDPGAVKGKYVEKDMALKIALACGKELEKHGVKVTYSRKKDENDPVEDEVAEANKSKADIAVSFHANAGGGDGCEFYYWMGDKKGKKLCDMFWTAMQGIGQNAHGKPVKDGSWLYWCRNTSMTAVLAESFFLDSSDVKIGNTDAKLKKMGVAYAQAIIKYFNVGKTYEIRATCASKSIANNALITLDKLGITGKIYE